LLETRLFEKIGRSLNDVETPSFQLRTAAPEQKLARGAVGYEKIT
jgi:hypothetical protein